MKRYLAIILLVTCLNAWVAAQQPTDFEPLTIHLFYSPTCSYCHEVRALVNRLQAEGPRVQVVEHNLAEPQNIELMADYYASRGVPPEQWGGTIAVFVGDRWWNDTDQILEELEPAVSSMIGTGIADRPDETGASLIELFQGFGVFTVAVAGLLDGVNPCAMATLIFLISYLSFAGRSSRQVLATGLLFAAGIFVAYLGIGMGALRALQMVAGLSLASKLLYPAMAVGTLLLAVYSFRDYLRARVGAVSDMTLKLPKPVTKLSHSILRGSVGPCAFLGFAFVAGLLISILELFCTGQIYLPTLMYMWSTETLRARTFQLLVLYVAMFTLPIVALTIVAYVGANSQHLAEITRRHTAAVKLAITGLFVALTIYLGSVSFTLLSG